MNTHASTMYHLILRYGLVATALVATTSSTLAAPINTTNLLLNPGAEANSLTNWISGGVSIPRVDNGSFDLGINPHSGTNDFLAGTGANGSLSQMVSLVGNQGITTNAIDGGSLLANISFWEQGLSQATLSDDAFISLSFWGATSNVLSTVTTPEIDSHNLTWSNYTGFYKLPVGTRYIQYAMNFVRHSGTDLDAFVDDNSLVVLDASLLPKLNITLLSTNAVVSWPTNNATGFILQQSTNLATTNWSNTTNLVTTAGGTNQIIVWPVTGNRFYRLTHP